MTTPTVTEIKPEAFRAVQRAAQAAIAYDADYNLAGSYHGYRERAEQLRQMDTTHCDEHGSLAIYCGCES